MSGTSLKSVINGTDKRKDISRDKKDTLNKMRISAVGSTQRRKRIISLHTDWQKNTL